MVTLLNVPISPFGAKVTLALVEKGIVFESCEPDLEAAQAGHDPQLTGEVSPRLEIPLLLDGDVAVFDSTIILEYLEDRWPDPPLLPRAPADRARVRMLEDVCDTTYEAVVWGIYETLMMGRVTGPQQDALLAKGSAQARGLNAWLDRQLGTRKWFNGESLGWGDVSVYPPVNNADRLGVSPEPGSRLETWLARMRERPSTQRLQAEFAAWVETPLNRPMGTTATWKRLYKSHRLEWLIANGAIDVVAKGIADDNVRFSNNIT